MRESILKSNANKSKETFASVERFCLKTQEVLSCLLHRQRSWMLPIHIRKAVFLRQHRGDSEFDRSKYPTGFNMLSVRTNPG